MDKHMLKIFVVGVGPFDEKYRIKLADEVIEKSDFILSTKRIANSINKDITILSIDEIYSFIEAHINCEKTICVLASGDIGFFSIAQGIKNKFNDISKIEFISGISSFQYLTSKLLLPYNEIKLVSAHGKDINILPYICYNKMSFFLCGGKINANTIIDEIYNNNLFDIKIIVGQNLSMKEENIIQGNAEELHNYSFDKLAVVLIINDNFVNKHEILLDDDFIRDKIPMTKEIVRMCSVDKLNVNPWDVVYDIGAGSGSVSIALARKAFESVVYAVEKNSLAIDLIKKNIIKHKAYNCKIIEGFAPEVLDNLPIPNKVFIGGTTGNLKTIIDCLISKNKDVKIVVNAICIETLANTVECFKENNFKYNINCVNVSNSEKIKDYHLMKASNPVYIIERLV